MKPFLMGTETEYAVSGRTAAGMVAAEDVYFVLNDAVRQVRRWMPDVGGGRALYLEHGGRFYLDSGGHPEYATPEVFTPAQVAAADKAGERILLQATERARAARPDLHVTVTKNNIGPVFPDRVTWGCHESHTSWQPHERVGPMLIPHLVSRTIYSGSGSLSARPGGRGLELSQRARHICSVTGTETTSNRPIFCTRIRKAADASRDGWYRVHLVCKDSQRAPFGVYLTFGTTGVLFLLMNEGREVGKGLELANPVQALQAISLDPWLRTRVPLKDGRRLTALEIQEAYWEQCDRELSGGGFPDWAYDVMRHWGQTLADLKRDPLRLARRLDPYCKLLIYGHELDRAGYSWPDLHQALWTMEKLREAHPEAVVKAVLTEDDSALAEEQKPSLEQAREAVQARQPGVLDRLRFAVRLQALELRYHELGGLYDQLADAGQVEAVVLTSEDVEQASYEPPPGGRAAVRSECIKSLQDPGWVCDWRYLFHHASGTFVDLRDPFVADKRVLRREQMDELGRHDLEMLETFDRLMRRRL